MAGIVVATQNGVVSTGGRHPIAIRKGEAWAADSDIVKAHPDLFSKDPATARGGRDLAGVGRPVERHTKAPGERSTAKRAEA